MATPAIEQRKPAGPLQSVLDTFSSVKLTVVLLVALAATSIIGTLIEQNLDPEVYIQAYGQSRYELFRSLQLTDLYHSWWFITLLTLLIINLLVCSIRRLPTSLKAMSPPNYRIDEGFFAKQHEHATLKTNLSPQEVVSRAAPLIRTGFTAKGAPLWLLAAVAGLIGVFAGLIMSNEQWVVLTSIGVCEAVVLGVEMLRRSRAPLPETLSEEAGKGEGDGQAVVLYAEKGRLSRLGVYVVHASIILIMAGAILGLLYGFRGGILIPEGNAYDYFFLHQPKEQRQLPFSVRMDDFSVSFYPSGAPKEFKSIVSIIDGGKVVLTTPVLVNTPLSYKGYRLYQSNYQPVELLGLSLQVEPRGGGQGAVVPLTGFNQPAPLPGGGTVSAVSFEKDLLNYLGPAVMLHQQRPDGSQVDFWVLERDPNFDRGRHGELVFVPQMNVRYASGLEVSHDPGVWVVWGGCTLMVLGFLVAFFMSHRRLWLRAARKGGKTVVQIGGRTNKNRPGFENEFAALGEALKGVLS